MSFSCWTIRIRQIVYGACLLLTVMLFVQLSRHSDRIATLTAHRATDDSGISIAGLSFERGGMDAHRSNHSDNAAQTIVTSVQADVAVTGDPSAAVEADAAAMGDPSAAGEADAAARGDPPAAGESDAAARKEPSAAGEADAAVRKETPAAGESDAAARKEPSAPGEADAAAKGDPSAAGEADAAAKGDPSAAREADAAATADPLAVAEKPQQIPGDKTQDGDQTQLEVDDDMKTIRVCTQRERLDHLAAQCRRYRSDMPASRLTPATRSLADNIHHLLYCYMSKVGCTSFTELMARANAKHLGNLATVPHGMSIHNHDMLSRKYNLTVLHKMNHEQIAWRVDNYFRFMIVRHPMERLISAWRDKVCHIEQSEFKQWPMEIFTYTRPNIFLNATSVAEEHAKEFRQFKISRAKTFHSSTYITKAFVAHRQGCPRFDEFLTWITRSKTYNEHWLTAVDSCHVCGHDWDALLRLETLEIDSPTVTSRLGDDFEGGGVPVVHSMRGAASPRITPSQNLELWRNVSKPVQDYFVDMYRVDMELFGYQWDSSTGQTQCSIQTASGTCC